KVKKRGHFRETSLDKLKLYSIVANRRVQELLPKDFRSGYFMKIRAKARVKKFVSQRSILRKIFEIFSSLAQP
ncbi:hypothetical protein MUP65_01435, partial [Patescibacteria group bacterium]|nr:hypothetical protein [Patescibacteria group bacterium]